MAEMDRMARIKAEIVYPASLLPETLEDLIVRLDYLDNRAVALAAAHEIRDQIYSEGLILAVKKAIQGINRRDCLSSVSQAARAREDRLLRLRDSDGRAKARR